MTVEVTRRKVANTDSIARLIAREMRAPLKKPCPKCKGWPTETEATALCARCHQRGYV